VTSMEGPYVVRSIASGASPLVTEQAYLDGGRRGPAELALDDLDLTRSCTSRCSCGGFSDHATRVREWDTVAP
jgi:hypothetical protein